MNERLSDIVSGLLKGTEEERFRAACMLGSLESSLGVIVESLLYVLVQDSSDLVRGAAQGALFRLDRKHDVVEEALAMLRRMTSPQIACLIELLEAEREGRKG